MSETLHTSIKRATSAIARAKAAGLSRDTIRIRQTRLKLLEGELKQAQIAHRQAIAFHAESCEVFQESLDELLQAIAQMTNAAHKVNELGQPLGIRPTVGAHCIFMVRRLRQCLETFRGDPVFTAIAPNSKSVQRWPVNQKEGNDANSHNPEQVSDFGRDRSDA